MSPQPNEFILCGDNIQACIAQPFIHSGQVSEIKSVCVCVGGGRCGEKVEWNGVGGRVKERRKVAQHGLFSTYM
jgi:hypothetical protein